MKLDILAIGAHPDDVELGCAATLIKHVQKGQKVGVLDLTEGELGSRGTVATRYTEAANAAQIMGLVMRENLQIPDGFYLNDNDTRLKVIEVIRAYQPDIIIGNASEDRHPDHGRGYRLVEDACFLSGLVKIETSRNGVAQKAWRPKLVLHYIQDRHIEPDVIIDVTATWEEKVKAIRAYETQFFAGTPGDSEPMTYISQPGFLDVIEAKAKVLGHRVGCKYAEGFTVAGKIGINDLDDLYKPAFS